MRSYGPDDSTTKRSSRPIWLGVDKRKWDHMRIHMQVLQDVRLGSNELAVYLGLVAHAELDTGECHPSATLLSLYTGLSVRSIQYSVRVLEDAGYIAVENVSGKSNIYHVLPPPELFHTPATCAQVDNDDPCTTCATTPAESARALRKNKNHLNKTENATVDNQLTNRQRPDFAEARIKLR